MNSLDDEFVKPLLELAQREDLGSGDVTTALLDHPAETATFALLAKQQGVFAGREVARAVLALYDPAIELTWEPSMDDGCVMDRLPLRVAMMRGSLKSILTAERVLLNVFQRLCGVATLTRKFVDAVTGTGSHIYDTRKTTPGWRVLEKYAVRCGGGRNHRLGLHDAVLIKDNHLHGLPRHRLAGAVFRMLNRLSELPRKPDFVEVEACDPGQVEELLKVVGIDVILLDNFSIDELRGAVRLRGDLGLSKKVEFEASGGITLSTVRAVAETGVDRISVGAITHSAPAIDLCLERL